MANERGTLVISPSPKHQLLGGLAGMATLLFASSALAQNVADVPRNETLVLTPWGDQPAQLANVDNWNPYLTSVTHQRDAMQFTVNEELFYTNLTDGKLIPWQAEGFDLSPDFLTATIRLRKGVTWQDGQPFTSADVKFTLEALRDAPPEINGASDYKEYVQSVDAPDSLTAVIHFTKPAPRWVRDHLALGHENHYPILPKHIWQGQDIKAFANYDLAKGLPIGTGPYKLVSSTNQQEVFDRSDTWWGVKIGFAPLPEPKRIVIVPVASDDAMGQLQIANQVDGGRQLLIGTFEAAQAQNPKLTSWNTQGPVWGAPDGCTYSLVFNNLKPPWNDINLHQAVDHAINRAKLSDIGYEGSNHPVSFAFSGYIAGTYLKPGGLLQSVIEKHDIDHQDQALVDKYMAAAGFTKGPAGFWAKDGKTLKFQVRVPAFLQPIQAPLTQQLKDAGFDAMQAPIDDSWLADLTNGNFDTMVFVHCGSLSEPVETLKDYHSKYARPLGTAVPYIIADSRYSNPEYDKLIDEMLATRANPDPNSKYMKDAAAALDIALRDLPQIDLLEEFHVVTFNNTYWTGWPGAADSYAAPYTPWEAFNLVIHHLKPVQSP
jgi:peptide/nickel transport system substrate-binding protein